MDSKLIEAAKNYRLTVLEKKSAHWERELDELKKALNRLQNEAVLRTALKAPELQLPVLEEPKEISYRPVNGKKIRNRTPDVVAQRWLIS